MTIQEGHEKRHVIRYLPDQKKLFFVLLPRPLGPRLTLELDQPFRISVNAQYRFLLRLFRTRFTFAKLLLDLIAVKLIQNKRFLQYAGCIESKNSGVLIVGPSESGKTWLCSSLANEPGTKYLSDDMVILDGSGNAYCLPTPLPAYTVKGGTGLRLNKVLMRIGKLIIPSIWLGQEPLIYPSMYRRYLTIGEKTKINTVCFLEEHWQPEIRQIDGATAKQKLLGVNWYELPWFVNPYISTWVYFADAPLRNLVREEESLMDGFLSTVKKFYVLRGSRAHRDKLLRKCLE